MVEFTLPKGSTILVTGVNGFIASHVADQLLLRGYKVRGTVRDVNKWQWLSERFEKDYGKDMFELVCVPDFTKPDAFHEVVKGASGVAHIATVNSFSTDPKEVVTPTVAAVTSALQAAADTESVKSFVFTSSSVAALIPERNKKVFVNKETWNTTSTDIAWSGADREDMALQVYAASKVEAERELWRFQAEKKPHFTVNAVLPNFNSGPLMHPTLQAGSTAGCALDVYTGKDTTTMASFLPQFYVDVRDTALLHIGCLLLPGMNGERLLGFAGPYNFNGFLKLLKKIDPSRDYREPIGNDDEDLSVVDTARAEEVLRLMGKQGGWTSMEQSVRDGIASIQ